VIDAKTLQKLYCEVKQWRKFMDQYSKFITPLNALHSLRWGASESGEVVDASMHELGLYVRNNHAERSVVKELADTIFMDLTALPDDYVYNDSVYRSHFVDEMEPDVIVDRINYLQTNAVMLWRYTQRKGIDNPYLWVTQIEDILHCAMRYPGFDIGSEVWRTMNRFARKHLPSEYWEEYENLFHNTYTSYYKENAV
jgi:hypothetical protein